MGNIEMHDAPPDARGSLDWTQSDEVALALIDNPGKWALITTRKNIMYRSFSTLRIRYGTGFTFKTYHNKESALLEIWACYTGSPEHGAAVDSEGK